MEYNGKQYELLIDKTGNLDCGDCCFKQEGCSLITKEHCNRYQVWKECALAQNTPTSSEQLAAPAVSVVREPVRGATLTPHSCPVCGGNGIVAKGFYMQTSGQWSTTDATPEVCRSCQGTGIVWG